MTHGVVVHVLGEGAERDELVACLEEVGPIGVAEELHVARRSATACSGEPFAAAREAEAVGGRRAHRDPVDRDAHRAREPRAHRDSHVGDLRPLADEDAIRVHELEPGHANDLVAPLEQPDRGRVEPLRVGRGEELADVSLPGRAEDRVDERVGDHVAIRVARQPRLAGKVDACEHERDPVREPVRVHAEPDPQVAHSQEATSTRSAAPVTLSRCGSP